MYSTGRKIANEIDTTHEGKRLYWTVRFSSSVPYVDDRQGPLLGSERKVQCSRASTFHSLCGLVQRHEIPTGFRLCGHPSGSLLQYTYDGVYGIRIYHVVVVFIRTVEIGTYRIIVCAEEFTGEWRDQRRFSSWFRRISLLSLSFAGTRVGENVKPIASLVIEYRISEHVNLSLGWLI